jgi:hypothetical protein
MTENEHDKGEIMMDRPDDRSSDGPPRPTAAAKAEFYVYFAMIFAATMPLAALTWALAR